MASFQKRMATTGLLVVCAGLSSAASIDGDCFTILEQSQALSATYPKRIAHGIHSLTLADLRYYFNANANETNNIPTINRDLSSPIPILNDAPDIGRSDRFKTIGLLVAEEVVLNEDPDYDLRNADTLEKLLHGLHMHEMWTETSRLYKNLLVNPPADPNICPCLADVENNGIYFNLRNMALYIREPELGFNTENKRLPRGGRARGSYCRNANCCLHCDGDIIIAKRAAEEDVKEGAMSKDTNTDYVDLFRRFAAMTDSISSDLAMFLYCMLN